ncbi:hypothetical protein P8X24_10980 [Pyrococcus kukulkanii]|uniref:hypothetical protein n=1 Tax=Pyrococcus kukulkanii TaxID=1609559 RepID=UPI0035694A43
MNMIANWVRAGNIQVSYVIDKAREDWRRVRVQGTVHVVVKGRDVKRLLNGNVLDELRTDFGMELVEHKFVDYDVKEYLFLKFRVDKVFEPFFNVHEFERGLVERFLELFFVYAD